jgi:hypothetical protein
MAWVVQHAIAPKEHERKLLTKQMRSVEVRPSI